MRHFTVNTALTDKTRKIVQGFIETIWNSAKFDLLDEYLHNDFTDHSLPTALPPDKKGLILWIKETGKAFRHHTVIEEQVTEGNKCIIKIRMQLTHVGVWRNMGASGAAVSVVGYRCFRILDNKIREHWALIDGNSIENQIREAAHGCKIQK